MPSKTKLKNAAIPARSAALPSIPKELIDQFVNGLMSAEAMNAVSAAFKKAMIECALGAALSHQVGYPVGHAKSNFRPIAQGCGAMYSAATEMVGRGSC